MPYLEHAIQLFLLDFLKFNIIPVIFVSPMILDESCALPLHWAKGSTCTSLVGLVALFAHNLNTPGMHSTVKTNGKLHWISGCESNEQHRVHHVDR